MKTKILLFGVLAEEAGSSSISVVNVETLDELIKKVIARYPSFAKYNFQVSVNKTLTRDNIKLNDNDEVAFLPPFAGG